MLAFAAAAKRRIRRRRQHVKALMPKPFLGLFFSILLASSVFAASGAPNLITNVPNRTTISLNGTWKYIVDPYATGFGMRVYEDRKPKDKSELVEYDFDASPSLKVPGDWNSQHENLLFYEGIVWYRKAFTYHKRAHARCFLYFGAANYQASVYLDGKKLGEHQGGFTPFNFEVTDAISDGDNFLVVEVNNVRRPDGVPSTNTDWWNYGGITRDVSLVEVPETFIEDSFVQLAKSSPNEIAGWVRLNGSAKPEQVTIDIPEAGVHQAITTHAGGYVEFHFPAKLDLWSPEHPKLYKVVLSAAGDRLEDEIGFRTIETRGSQILLNGKPIFLRGVSMHEEAPFRGGRAFSPEDAQISLGWAKELGCNFIRLAHYPHNENEIRLADKIGLLVWSEIPVYWSVDWENPATMQLAQDQLRDMIARDRNRASIIFWSLSNETGIDTPRTEFIKKLAASARQLDSTRLITSALNHWQNPAPYSRLLNDPLCEFLDVFGVNEYIGWYEGHPEDIARTHWSFALDKPVILSEFGAGALYGKHGDTETRFSEEFQANIIDQQIQMAKQIPSLAGMTPWVLMDFRSPRRLLPGIQDYRNRKGLVSDRGERKQAFYVLQKFYAEKAKETP
jgi:beta-glucuronidase